MTVLDLGIPIRLDLMNDNSFGLDPHFQPVVVHDWGEILTMASRYPNTLDDDVGRALEALQTMRTIFEVGRVTAC